MEGDAPQLDAATRAALQTLADIAVPPPVSMMPATWGWALLAAVLALLIAAAALRWLRQRRANRYRREALAALEALRPHLAAPESRAEALRAMAPLIKRTAIAAWPRRDVAALSGPDWVEFLRRSDGRGGLPASDWALLDDLEYRGQDALAQVDERQARAFFSAAAGWIEAHRVPA